MKLRKEREYIKINFYRYKIIVDRMDKELFIAQYISGWSSEIIKRSLRNYRVIHRNLDCKARINKNKSFRIRS